MNSNKIPSPVFFMISCYINVSTRFLPLEMMLVVKGYNNENLVFHSLVSLGNKGGECQEKLVAWEMRGTPSKSEFDA